jgi:hypothetical protein
MSITNPTTNEIQVIVDYPFMHYKLCNFDHFPRLILTLDSKDGIIICGRAGRSFPASPGGVVLNCPR